MYKTSKPIAVSVTVTLMLVSMAAMSKDRADQLLERFDTNKDGKISRAEWTGPAPRFRAIDANNDGELTREEINQFFASQGDTAFPKSFGTEQILANDLSVDSGVNNRVEESEIRNPFKQAFIAGGASKDVLKSAGMDVTGLVAEFLPEDLCVDVDHVYGEQWQGPADSLHSGADIPAQQGASILAIADGVLIHKAEVGDQARTARGNTVVLQHSPKDTGLPFWLYTTYTHFNRMPDIEIGTRIKMGEVLGPNGRSGITGSRAAHLHLTVNIGPSEKYAIIRGTVVPHLATYIDPVALFRKKLPMDTESMKALPAAEKRVPISYVKSTGAIYPSDTKLIWPFACKAR